MDIIIFDMVGKFAHFRKYYTNSSSLSYSVPPRTSIIGTIAAILGYERDSYYEKLNRENFNVALRKISKNRRLMQTLNYMKMTTASHITEPKEHTQIPFEIITEDSNVIYRIYVSHKDKKIMDEIERRLIEKKYYYSPYMGAAPFSCNLKFIDRVNGQVSQEEEISISSIIKSDYICEKGINFFQNDFSLLRERMPSDFNKNREIKSVDSYIFDDSGKDIQVKLNIKALNIEYKENNNICNESIVFM
ncbi:CRISPR-associated protein Cas5 [Clostridium acetireducens DSM 10703]|uniref:CRISPR-associated protein Cas5 n=1 Tax=Clostridium acetireducens DSM 10703 TaxID=1121290 RepID=A0A1E8EX95_9CLOT|nr:type I-B CRISPR-associated protein Cas5b [Clostridium acetireducens]OFI05279.1 CRISPR-associated protein Cas5 [Clostridium acetireducens DSM 10703]